jgi:hypothetical protein
VRGTRPSVILRLGPHIIALQPAEALGSKSQNDQGISLTAGADLYWRSSTVICPLDAGFIMTEG